MTPEGRVNLEVAQALSQFKIYVLPRKTGNLRCSIWDMPDPRYHIGVAWRENTGVARYGKRQVRFGMVGQADWSGWLFGTGRRFQIEAKAKDGKLTPDQQAHGRLSFETGCFWGIVRSYDDTVSLLANWGLKALL